MFSIQSVIPTPLLSEASITRTFGVVVPPRLNKPGPVEIPPPDKIGPASHIPEFASNPGNPVTPVIPVNPVKP